MRIVEKGILDLTTQELKQCRNLSLRDGGLMCDRLTEWRWQEQRPNNRMRRKCRVIMIKYDDSDSLIAWALVFPAWQRGYEAYFYTRARERCKGYGSILLERVRLIDAKPRVCPHDHRSGYFFRKHRDKIKFDEYDGRWLES